MKPTILAGGGEAHVGPAASHLSYRPEVDGLRAIAVTSVLLYHADLKVAGKGLLPGGFLGVDVFFVISGYLIAALLLKELQARGAVSFAGFYERRARRILPALFLVMLASMPFAWWYLLPPELAGFSESILYALAFASNGFFHFSGLEYGATASEYLPFLHTWSLAVEEQFYLLFPLLLLLAYRISRDHLVGLTTLGIVGSILLAHWGSSAHQSANFYLLHSRAWELFAGVLLAVMESRAGRRVPAGEWSKTLPMAGLGLIAYALIFYDKGVAHPSLLTLVPIIGVCLVIWFSQADDLATKVLSTRGFVAVGLISYSLYLWHYPVFAFSRITSLSVSRADKVVWILASFALAVATFYAVERPFRNRQKIGPKAFWLTLGGALAAIVAANLLIVRSEGVADRVPSNLVRSNIDERFFRQNHGIYQKCHKNFDAEKDDFCIFNGHFADAVYLVGDSHMGAISFDLAGRLEASSMKLVSMTKTGAYLMSEVPERSAYERKRVQSLRQVESSIVVIGGYYHQTQAIQKRLPEFKREFSAMVSTLLENGNQVVLIYPVPDFQRSVPEMMFRKGAGPGAQKPVRITSDLSGYRARTEELFRFFDSLPAAVRRVHPHAIFCDERSAKCFGNDEAEPWYSDTDHLSARGADMLNAAVMGHIREIKAARGPR